MTNPYRAMCSHPLAQEAYVAFVQICKGGSDDTGTYDADEEIVRRALRRLDELESALLAEPEPERLTDLLPCPFCGSTNLRHEFTGSQGFIECNECGATGPCDERAADPICDSEASVTAWNCRPTPQPPAAGEVAELQRWGVVHGAQPGRPLLYPMEDGYWTPWHIANDLLQHQHPQPVAVSERLPEPSVKVLAHYFNALGKGRTICAIWVPAKSRSDEGELDSDDFLEYDEESDKYYWPEGWYEAIENWEELGWAKVYAGEIAYWQPLPQWPANALPTPETP